MMEVTNESLDSWLAVLKPYQRKSIKSLLECNGGDEEKVAQLWLNSYGPINTATFGGVPSSSINKNYFQCLKDELNGLICGSEKYEEERKSILQKGELINIATSTKIAYLLAPIVGLSEVVLTPAVVLLLHVIGKVSVNAYCSMINRT